MATKREHTFENKATKREDGNENPKKNKIKKTLSEEKTQEDDYENFSHGNETDINIKPHLL